MYLLFWNGQLVWCSYILIHRSWQLGSNNFIWAHEIFMRVTFLETVSEVHISLPSCDNNCHNNKRVIIIYNPNQHTLRMKGCKFIIVLEWVVVSCKLGLWSSCVHLCVCVCVRECVRSVVSDSFWYTRDCNPSRLIWLWDFLGQNTRENGLLIPPSGFLPYPELNSRSLVSPALASAFFTTEPLGIPWSSYLRPFLAALLVCLIEKVPEALSIPLPPRS